MDNSDFTENPEYQRAMQKLMQAPQAIRAIANIAPIDETAMGQLAEKNLTLRKLGEAKTAGQDKLAETSREFEGKLGLAKANTNLDATLGLSNLKSNITLRENTAQTALNELKTKTVSSAGLGLLNLGAAGYGAYQQNDINQRLLPLYLNRLQGVA